MLLDLSILELSQGLKKKNFSSVDLVLECFSMIEKWDKEIHAFITVLDKKDVLKKAEVCDKNQSNDRHLLYGIPYVMKDSYLTKDIRTTSASNVLRSFIPQYSATVYRKLEQTGALLIGKMNMDAWGHGGTSENTDFTAVRNPWDTSRSAGGSTGGVAAALALRMAAFGIGEDTGGSIRNPAAWCNVTGLKVTYGRVSRYGCIAYASSFDTVGPMAKTVEDCAYVLQAIAGIDEYDATSSPLEVPNYTDKYTVNSKKIVLGVPKELFGEGLDKEVHNSIQNALKDFEACGYVIKEISMPMIHFGIPVYYLIAPSETSSNLGRYDGIRYGSTREAFSEETKRRIMIGTYALSAGYYDAYYKKAQQMRTLFIEEYKKALSECDAIVMPVTPTPATTLGTSIDDPVQNMLIDTYTTTQNPVGVPSLALPCGFTKSGLPIGMQIVAAMFEEPLLFQIGTAYQKRTDWHTKKPKEMI